ncbi:hypothetical protein IEQ34_007923 [Dendrobium chrysotoxum]|uniref:Auxin-responsive protein n=1 Tax=Dendrobium chrysotoxum TaxID=161865 RepID=A0AAV7H4D9_DENCH|nr:hypothetical protein IEQ34_007923 [Dendrobium chrysotoxum]
MRRSFEFAGVSYPPTSEMSRASNGDPGATETRERANELELGLSLGRGVRRIITAEDFPSLRSISSNSSVSSSSGGLGDEADQGDGGGSYRRADAVGYNGARSTNSLSHNQVVGWPPIRICRRNNLVNTSRVANSVVKATTPKEISQSCSSNAGKKGIGGNDGEREAINVQRSLFVKVNMDGDPIGRKVDLHTHVSYEALALALEAMFHKPTFSLNASASEHLFYVAFIHAFIHLMHDKKSCILLLTDGMFSKLLNGSSEFSLIYEDEDGDWMLVGDVPWGMFLRTAKRLRIMKTMDTCGHDQSVNPEPWLSRPIKSSVPL